MPKTIDHRDLKSATARSKLAIAKKPYWLSLAPGIALGYRRNGGRQSGETRSQAVGSWSVRYHGTNGAEWLKKIAIADDVESANSALGILDFTQAKEAALKLARTQPGVPEDTSRPLTVDEALDQYKQDLKARGASVYNESQLRGHVTASLLSKPVQLLAKSELTTWRNGLTAKMKPASVNRVCKSFRAALNLAANNDSRIANRDAWKLGLKGLPNAEEDRNVILTDEEVGSILLATYDRDDALGLFVHVLAETGARPSQAARLLVADLVLTNPKAPRLMMPRSGKGMGGVERKVQRYSVNVTPNLAQRLKLVTKGRSSRQHLLLQSNGQPWAGTRNRDQEVPGSNWNASEAYRRPMREVIKSIGLDPDEVTIYALRHSSIVRWLLKGANTRLVASLHDTSVAMIEKHYSRHIGDHIPEDLARRAMLHLPAGGDAGNVVALR